jgi:hypothetical protein
MVHCHNEAHDFAKKHELDLSQGWTMKEYKRDPEATNAQ